MRTILAPLLVAAGIAAGVLAAPTLRPAALADMAPMTGMTAPMRPIDRRLMAPMDRMNAAMGAARLTGDADHDFLTLMIPHHAAAVGMARVELERGRRPEVKRLARAIVAAQNEEIGQMRGWLRR